MASYLCRFLLLIKYFSFFSHPSRLITGGILSTVDFSIVNSDTDAVIMSHVYTDQGNIGIYIPAGVYIYLFTTDHF
jgi:hypothetical protein